MMSRKLALCSALVALGVMVGCSSDRNMEGYSTQSGGIDYLETQDYIADSSIGPVLTNPQGMTVYTYDNDQSGASSCYGECASKWQPVGASPTATPYANMTIIERTDGRRQWAYNGMPLYTYADDTTMGDVRGDNEGGVWHVVQR